MPSHNRTSAVNSVIYIHIMFYAAHKDCSIATRLLPATYALQDKGVAIKLVYTSDSITA